MRQLARRLLPVVCCVSLVLSCAAGTQKPAIATALDNEATRHESLEATLRVLDEHPEYVDELFQLTLRHPRTLNRFLHNAAQNLSQDPLARTTAFHLTRSPAGVRQTFIATLDAASNKPEALDAIASAMAERPQVAAIAITQRDDAIRTTMRELIDEVQKNSEARESFLIALKENSPDLANLIARNPSVLGALLEAFADAGVSVGDQKIKDLLSDDKKQEE